MTPNNGRGANTMGDEQQRSTINRTARLAGALYLLMAPFAAFSLSVRFSAFVHADAEQTVANIAAAESQVLFAIVTWLVAQTLSIFLVLALYKVLRPVDKSRALLMVVLALIGVPIIVLNELNQFAVLFLMSGADYLQSLDPAQLQAQVMFFLHMHEHGIQIGHIFWGLWLLPFGYLVLRSGFLPSVLGVLLIVAGIGYLIDLAIYLALPELNLTVTQYTFVGELLLPLWLLAKGVNVERWNRCAAPA